MPSVTHDQGSDAAAEPAGTPDAGAADGGKERRNLLRALGASTALLTAANLLASMLNYGSNLVFGRLLEPHGYSELTALLAFTVIIGVSATAAQTMLAERVAYYRSIGDLHTVRYLVRHSLAHLGVVGGIVAVVILAATPLLMAVLSIGQPGPVIALAALVLASFLLPAALGLMQGMELAAGYAALILAAAVGRLVLGAAWAALGGGAGGALAGQAIGIIVAGFAAAFALRRYGLAGGHGAVTRGLRRKPDIRALQAGGAFTLFAIMGNADVIAAKILLDSTQAGYYAALATVAKIIAYLPAAALVLLVPRAATAIGPAERQSELRRGAALSVGLMALVAVPLALFPASSVHLMFGDAYSAATGGVHLAVLAGFGLGLISLLVTFSVTIRHGRWQWTLVAGLGSFALAATIWHDTAIDIARCQAFAVFVTLLVNEVKFHSLVRPKWGP